MLSSLNSKQWLMLCRIVALLHLVCTAQLMKSWVGLIALLLFLHRCIEFVSYPWHKSSLDKYTLYHLYLYSLPMEESLIFNINFNKESHQTHSLKLWKKAKHTELSTFQNEMFYVSCFFVSHKGKFVFAINQLSIFAFCDRKEIV